MSHAEPNWEALARSPQFHELLASRRRFVTRATLFYSLYFTAYLALLGFAPGTMSDEPVGSLSWALLGGFSVCVLTVLMAVLYARRAEAWSRMSERVVAEAGR
jgi:uncharacterized membrane protein (DUF485 family)